MELPIELYCEGCERQGRCDISCAERNEYIYKHFFLKEGISMNFTVEDKTVNAVIVEKIITGNSTYRTSFDLDEEWDGFIISAVFKFTTEYGHTTTIPVLLQNSECLMPTPEAPGTLQVGIRGINAKKELKASELSKPIPVFAGARGEYLNDAPINSYDKIIEALIDKANKTKVFTTTADEYGVNPEDNSRTISPSVDSRTYITGCEGLWKVLLPDNAEAGDMVSIRMTTADSAPQISFINGNVIISGNTTLRANAKARIMAEFDGADWMIIIGSVG